MAGMSFFALLKSLFTLLTVLLFGAYWALIIYYRRAWQAIPGFIPSGRESLRTRITVLVPARNEERNIAGCLGSLSRQTYPGELYEVIVIDDHSTDQTAAITRSFGERGNSAGGVDAKGNIRCLGPADRLWTGGGGKKKAIEAGVQASTGELIVTTDADCRFDPDWLVTIARFYEATGAQFIAAPVRIGPIRWTLLSVFQTLDFIVLQGITAAAVYRRFHTMCNGANLAYTKKAFYEVEGFKGIDSIPSGDDMLLMHKIYKRYPDRVLFLKSPQAVVHTAPETSWSGFLHQRVRWASKAGSYDDKRIFWVLLMVYLVNASFVLLAVAGCWSPWWWGVLATGLLIKVIVEFPFVRSVAVFFGQRGLLPWFPLLQPFHIIYTVVIGWMGKFGSYRWKDRKINI
jgi:biofilm PGA synthesis N-glycosyltransferase PgaC